MKTNSTMLKPLTVLFRASLFFLILLWANNAEATWSDDSLIVISHAPDSGMKSGPGDVRNGSIHGVVHTNDDKVAAGVSILLKGTNRGTVTGESGDFEFRRLNPGTYILEISLTGYQSIEQTVEVEDRKTTNVSVKLDISSKILDKVTVVSNRNPYSAKTPSPSLRLNEPLIQVAQNIQVVTAKALADQQVISMSDGVLRNVSGASRYEHWADLYTNVQMRGSQVTALRNGMAVATSYWSPLTEDMAVVDHIEFVKGPAGFLMPVGDPAGVYNVVTKRPTGESKGEVTLQAGSYDLYRATLDLDGKLDRQGRLLYRLNLSAKTANSFRAFEYNNRQTIAPVISYQLDDNTVLTAEYILSKVKSSNVGSYYVFSSKGMGVLPRNFTIADPGLEPTFITDQSVTVNLKHRFNDHWTFTAQAAYLQYNQTGTSLWAASASADSMVRSQGLWDAASTAKFGQAFLNGDFETGGVHHRVIIGLDAYDKEYFADFYNSHNLDLDDNQFKFADPSYGNPSNGYPAWDRSTPLRIRAGVYGTQTSMYTGIYVQDELGFFDNRLRLTLAGRYSYAKNDDYGSPEKAKEITPRAGISWSVDKQTSVYALFDDAFVPQSGFRRDGKPIKPLTGNNMEIGAKREFAGGKWTAGLSAYRIIRNNSITADPGDPTGEYVVQLGQTRSQGVELDLRGELAPGLTVTANYAYTNAVITRSDTSEAGKATIGQKVPGYSTHTANAWINYSIMKGPLKGLGFSLGASYLGDRQNWESGSTVPYQQSPDYKKLNGGIFYEIGPFRIALDMYNLTNNYTYNGSGYADYYYWQADPPLTWRLGIAYRF
jgi:iron complex outermembrane receptor protein